MEGCDCEEDNYHRWQCHICRVLAPVDPKLISAEVEGQVEVLSARGTLWVQCIQTQCSKKAHVHCILLNCPYIMDSRDEWRSYCCSDCQCKWFAFIFFLLVSVCLFFSIFYVILGVSWPILQRHRPDKAGTAEYLQYFCLQVDKRCCPGNTGACADHDAWASAASTVGT